MTGLWLVRLHVPWQKVNIFKRLRREKKTSTSGNSIELRKSKKIERKIAEQPPTSTAETSTSVAENHSMSTRIEPTSISEAKYPLSLYPAAMLGTAMTARGEIGFLIASLAETTGLFASSSGSPGSSDIYLVVIWAIVMCTIIGPLSVGTLVKRVRRLQKERGRNSRAGDPLGIWGVG